MSLPFVLLPIRRIRWSGWVNIFLAHTPISLAHFALSTVLGLVPMACTAAYVGAETVVLDGSGTLRSGDWNNTTIAVVVAYCLLAALNLAVIVRVAYSDMIAALALQSARAPNGSTQFSSAFEGNDLVGMS